MQDGGGVIHLLHGDQTGHVAGGAGDHVIEGEQHVVHGHGLAVVPGDALIGGEGGGHGVQIVAELPAGHEEGLHHAVGIHHCERSQNGGVVVDFAEGAALGHDGVAAVQRTGGADAQQIDAAVGRLGQGGDRADEQNDHQQDGEKPFHEKPLLSEILTNAVGAGLQFPSEHKKSGSESHFDKRAEKRRHTPPARSLLASFHIRSRRGSQRIKPNPKQAGLPAWTSLHGACLPGFPVTCSASRSFLTAAALHRSRTCFPFDRRKVELVSSEMTYSLVGVIIAQPFGPVNIEKRKKCFAQNAFLPD